MAGKSRRKRGRHSPSRKARGQQRAPATTRAPASPPPGEAIAQPEAASLPATAPSQTTRPQTVQFPYIVTELRTIGILAGIMLIILIILYFTLV